MPTADQQVRSRLVRVLAVLAALATIPLWAPPDHVTTSDGVFMVAAAAPHGVAVVRLAALVLVVLLAGLTLWRGRRVVALFAVPAVALSWVWWRTEGGGSYTVAMFGSAGQDPPHAFTSPWFAVAAALVLLVVLTWTLAAIGIAARVRRTPRGGPSTGRTG
ncbi:hypothetical protein ASD16_00150 [Cellulomonas sp. Root485]|uniref:hypothetical protein n=1 Tax=Cellulomonas sp. Root485 TaxID=1736546 RepID=UPI0006F5C083|nr:hypothetical protein [Cellulomonas sp. Root485]KQY24030.1 hypothetical protein ASD16_00150 [Cellulomonas sp. Root485]